MTESAMLETSATNYRVGLAFLAAEYKTGESLRDQDGKQLYFHRRSSGDGVDQGNSSSNLPERIRVTEGSFLGTVAVFPDGTKKSFTVVGSRYTVIQNQEILQQTLHVASILGNTVSGIGRSSRGNRFAVRFEPKDEFVLTTDGRSERFTRTLYAWSSHDKSYTYSIGFHIRDPENRCIADFTVKRKHTPNINADRELETMVSRLAEESNEVLNDVRQMALKKLDAQQLAVCLEVLVPMKQGGSNQSNNEQTAIDEEQTRVLQVRQQISQIFSSTSVRYGQTAWALYEAWISVVMKADQQRQQDAYESRDDGLILRILADRTEGLTNRYKKTRRELLDLIAE